MGCIRIQVHALAVALVQADRAIVDASRGRAGRRGAERGRLRTLLGAAAATTDRRQIVEATLLVRTVPEARQAGALDIAALTSHASDALRIHVGQRRAVVAALPAVARIVGRTAAGAAARVAGAHTHAAVDCAATHRSRPAAAARGTAGEGLPAPGPYSCAPSVVFATAVIRGATSTADE